MANVHIPAFTFHAKPCPLNSEHKGFIIGGSHVNCSVAGCPMMVIRLEAWEAMPRASELQDWKTAYAAFAQHKEDCSFEHNQICSCGRNAVADKYKAPPLCTTCNRPVNDAAMFCSNPCHSEEAFKGTEFCFRNGVLMHESLARFGDFLVEVGKKHT